METMHWKHFLTRAVKIKTALRYNVNLTLAIPCLKQATVGEVTIWSERELHALITRLPKKWPSLLEITWHLLSFMLLSLVLHTTERLENKSTSIQTRLLSRPLLWNTLSNQVGIQRLPYPVNYRGSSVYYLDVRLVPVDFTYFLL